MFNFYRFFRTFWFPTQPREFYFPVIYIRLPSRDAPKSLGPHLSFFLYILPGARFRALSAGVHCTLRVAGWKPTSNHIEITVGFFKLHRGWLSLHRGHPVNVLIRRTMHLSSVISVLNSTTVASPSGNPSLCFRPLAATLGMTARGRHCWEVCLCAGAPMISGYNYL